MLKVDGIGSSGDCFLFHGGCRGFPRHRLLSARLLMVTCCLAKRQQPDSGRGKKMQSYLTDGPFPGEAPTEFNRRAVCRRAKSPPHPHAPQSQDRRQAEARRRLGHRGDRVERPQKLGRALRRLEVCVVRARLKRRSDGKWVEVQLWNSPRGEQASAHEVPTSTLSGREQEVFHNE